MSEPRGGRSALLALALAVGAGCGSPGASDAQSWRTVTSSRQALGEKALAVEVEYGAGRLVVTMSLAGSAGSTVPKVSGSRAMPG